ncbi:MAG: hypothetical protein ACM31L_11435 [Actinomycetota bacterium]
MSGPGDKTSYEIQVFQDKHWVIAEMASDEAKAKAFADNLLQTGNHEAVRVVKDYRRSDGTHTETVVVEKKADARAAQPVQLSPITEAPPCAELADFYRLPARLTMGRLLRKYLDEVLVTPSELLLSAPELKRFGDKDRLLFAAIERVAALQAKVSGEDAKARKDQLDKVWEEILGKARAAQAKKLATPKSVAEALKTAGSGPDAEYLLSYLLAQALLERRSWLGKIDLLIAWTAEPDADKVMERIDGVVADIMLSAQVIQDLLGFQSNLAHALCHLVDLSEGKAETAKFAPASFTALNELFAKGRLPQSAKVLLTRVVRELGGTNPLSRNEPKQEYEMFHKVVHRLISRDGLIGGPASAEAILQRGSRTYSAGNTVGALQAMDFVISVLGEGCLTVQFMTQLVASTLGAGMPEAVTDMLAGEVRKASHIDAWVPVRVSPRDRMAALTSANAALLAAELPEELKAELGGVVDEVLAKYLLDEEVIEKIDKPDDPLALRAIRLIKFCGSGVLIKGKSLNLARERVIEHLKQKQFEEKFLASVPDQAQAEKHLREFHRLLVETGFR